MGLFDRIFSRPEARRSDDLAALREEVAQLRAQVRELDGLQLSREMTFRELSDKALKYLKRVQELQRRGETSESDQSEQVSRHLLALKFPNGRP